MKDSVKIGFFILIFDNVNAAKINKDNLAKIKNLKEIMFPKGELLKKEKLNQNPVPIIMEIIMNKKVAFRKVFFLSFR